MGSTNLPHTDLCRCVPQTWHTAPWHGRGGGGEAAKMFPFSPGAKLGAFGVLKNGGKNIIEIMGQAGVFPVIYPTSAKVALGWPTGRN